MGWKCPAARLVGVWLTARHDASVTHSSLPRARKVLLPRLTTFFLFTFHFPIAQICLPLTTIYPPNLVFSAQDAFSNNSLNC